MISVLLVDDHKIVRQGISSALKIDKTIKIVGEGTDGNSAIALTKSLDPDLIIMDINMPNLDGIEAAKEIRKFNKKVKILILTMLEDENYILDALSAQVDGYLLKMAGIDDLLYAVQTISQGESYFDPRVTKIVIESKKKSEPRKVELSKRELEILLEIVEGLTSKEIGEKLFISAFTVQKHRKNILKKLNLHGTAELVRFAIENKLS